MSATIRTIFCPHCGCNFKFTVSDQGKTAGALGGAAAGAALGAKIGIVAGPLGAMAGTVPGAVLGWVFGGKGGKVLIDNPQCPRCAKKFSLS